MLMKKWIGLMFAGAFLMGCNQWNPGEGYDYAVYSETGDSIAAVFQTFEEKNKITHMAQQNHETQVVLIGSNGKKNKISPLMPGDVRDLFYQEMEGYIILGRVSEYTELNDGSDEATISYDKISLNGTVTSLGKETGVVMLSCDGGQSSSSTTSILRVIPNPDGTMLARIKAETTCTKRTQTVTFLDAQSLEVIAGPFSAGPGSSTTAPNGNKFWNTTDVAWTEDGEFAFGQWGISLVPNKIEAQVFNPSESEGETTFMDYSCFYPPTASAYVNDSGEEVFITPESGDLSFTQSIQQDTGFGCNTP